MVTNQHLILFLSLSFIVFCSSCGKDRVFCASTKNGFNLNAEITSNLSIAVSKIFKRKTILRIQELIYMLLLISLFRLVYITL